VQIAALQVTQLTASLPAPQVTVQLTCHEPFAIAQGLLAWADALAEVTARPAIDAALTQPIVEEVKA
jgi:hypothetical protein